MALDISDPEHPQQVSSVTLGADENPHWISLDASGERIVLNSAGDGAGDRLFVINFDPTNGRLSMDDRFRDHGSTRTGIRVSAKTWLHGFVGPAAPHGTVFSR